MILEIVLVLLNFLELRVYLHLQPVILTLEVLPLVNQVSHLLIPLSPLSLMVEQQLSLLAFNFARLLLNLSLFGVKRLTFLLQLL